MSCGQSWDGASQRVVGCGGPRTPNGVGVQADADKITKELTHFERKTVTVALCFCPTEHLHGPGPGDRVAAVHLSLVARKKSFTVPIVGTQQRQTRHRNLLVFWFSFTRAQYSVSVYHISFAAVERRARSLSRPFATESPNRLRSPAELRHITTSACASTFHPHRSRLRGASLFAGR